MTPSLAASRSRLTRLLLAGQSLSSAGAIAGVTVATLVGAELSGRAALAGLPGAVYLLGTALAAYPAARLMERTGRRVGLTLGFTLGALGALIAGAAVWAGAFGLFMAGYLLMGMARGTNDLSRYAAAEMVPASDRGRAISLVVLGGTVGAIGGPLLVGPTGRLAAALGGPELAGPWFASLVLFSLGALLMGLWLRPDPSEIGRQLAALQPQPQAQAGPAARHRPLRVLMAQPALQTALAAMALGQLVMVMIMSITSLHMKGHGHGLGEISLVIMAHTLGMFGLSMVSGRLADSLGRAPTIILGSLLNVAACLLAPLSHDTGPLALALFLLGLGWNLCYVAGAALLTDSLSVAERGRMQGSTDLAVGLASALGNLGSGWIFALFGYTLINWISLGVSLVPLLLAAALLLRARRARLPLAPAEIEAQ